MNKIKEFRKKANVTQKQLGKNINKSQGAIAHYENQKRRNRYRNACGEHSGIHLRRVYTFQHTA